MIRNNIKINEDNLKNFLPFRDNIDQGGYRVGKINDEVVVINSDNIPMDNFYDDKLDIVWFDLELVDPLYKGYKINRDGVIIGIKNNSQLVIFTNINGYPVCKIKGKHPLIHRLLGKIFKPNYNPEINLEIDHIDRNKNNYSLNNLRWVSRVENVSNMSKPEWFGNKLYIAYSDKNLSNEVIRLTKAEMYDRYSTKIDYCKKYLYYNPLKSDCIKFDNYYWVIKDLDLINYLNGRAIDDSLWRKHYLGNFYVHPIGLIKTLQGVITPGSDNGHGRCYFFKGTRKLYIHRLVAEVFLNENKPLDKGLVVDHIDTNPVNNCLGNLRITNQKGNMNNPNTKLKLSKKVVDSNGIIYNSILDCAKHYKVSKSSIWNRLNGVQPSLGFHYLIEKTNNKD